MKAMKYLHQACWPALLFVVACGPSDEAATDAAASASKLPVMAEADAPADVIAVFEGGQITADAFDGAILSLPPEQRQSLTLGNPDAYRNIVREMAMDAVLVQEAKLLGIDQTTEFQTKVRALRRSIVVERFLQEHLPAVEPPTEAELKAEFERRRDEYQRPARRLVFHLFKRLEVGGSLDALQDEVADIRQQIVAGQGFNVLAARLSDSESRHRSGELGWFQPGQLSPDLDRVVFDLDEGVPSQPITTRDGVHLFYVDVAVDAKDFSFEEARQGLLRQVVNQRQGEAMTQLEQRLDVDADVFKPSPDELRAILQRGDPQEGVLRVGTFELPLRHFAVMLDNDRQQRPNAEGFRAEQVLRNVWRGELIFQQQQAAGIPLSAEDEQRVAEQSRQLLAFQGRQQKLRQRIEEDPEPVRTFFDDNRMRFTTPLRLRIRRLTLPLGERPSDHMALLERRRQDLDAGTLSLDDLAAELGGEVETLDWQNLPELHVSAPRLAQFAAETAAGRHSPPFRSEESLQIFRVEEREDPSPRPYEEVRDAVRAAYLERHGQRLYRELRDAVLTGAGFQIFEQRLEALLASGLTSSTGAE